MLAACSKTLSGKRDAALLSVGYYRLCRSSELSWMRVEDVRLDEARIYIPRSKSDLFGDGRFATFTVATTKLLERLLISSAITEGPLFRGLHSGQIGCTYLETSSIRRLPKSAACRAGFPDQARHLSGHSMRVGAAPDMLRAVLSTLAIMTAGGWKNDKVVCRYVEHSNLITKFHLSGALVPLAVSVCRRH